MTRTLLAASLALLLSLGTGCQVTLSAEEARSELSPGSVLLPVPSVPEEAEGSCGLDCVTALLRFHGLDIDEEGRRRFPVEDLERTWISAGELRDYLQDRGFRAYLVHGAMDWSRPGGILGLLERGLPVIVERKVAGSNHFYLVSGFDPERRTMFVMTADGVGTVPYDRFEKGWATCDHLMLVAAPRSKIAPPPTETSTPLDTPPFRSDQDH